MPRTSQLPKLCWRWKARGSVRVFNLIRAINLIRAFNLIRVFNLIRFLNIVCVFGRIRFLNPTRALKHNSWLNIIHVL